MTDFEIPVDIIMSNNQHNDSDSVSLADEEYETFSPTFAAAR